ncbi:MAG: dienelactone hydrolase family protein [Thermodesulfobacteriota bacterium]
MKRLFFVLLLLLCWSVPAFAAVVGESVTYNARDFVMEGYIAYDDSITTKRPGILVVHEWWGHNEYARKRARMLAELGYTALAVDMYGDGKQADHPGDASKFASEVRKNLSEAKHRFGAALQVLQKHPSVDPQHIAAIGYCFGGGIVLQMARQGLDLDAVVSFHGSLATDTPAIKGTVKARILVCYGANDKLVTPGQIQAFLREMKAADVDYKFISYPGAKHSFTNPDADTYAKKFNIPVGYSAEADQKSWQDMQNFLKDSFAK